MHRNIRPLTVRPSFRPSVSNLETHFGFDVIAWNARIFLSANILQTMWGWSGGAMVLGKRPVPGRPTVWIIVGQGPTALAGGAGGGCLDIFFSRLSFLFSYSLSLGDGPI